MLLKILGAMAVVAGCAGLGFYIAAKEGFRIRELLEFKKSLLILASEIEYKKNPLNTACENIANRTEGIVAKLYENYSVLLAESQGETAYRLWMLALENMQKKSFYTAEDIAVFDSFGKTLGYLDKPMQLNAINYSINCIDEKVAALQAAGDKNKRMYRSLGAIAGLLIIVLLW